MRCMCQNCGEYMVQDEKGILSRCICPNCFTTCNACLGTAQQPLDREGLRAMLIEREMHDRIEESLPADDAVGE